MSGTVIIKSRDRWYNLNIFFDAKPSLIELLKHFSTQNVVENILDTCGKGIKTFFIPGSGVYDHSPDWCSVHLKGIGKIVAEDYSSGPHARPDKYYDSLDNAVTATTQPFLYIWDGQKWEYRRVTYKRSSRGLPWSRNRINK